jgi:hypothetical protein
MTLDTWLTLATYINQVRKTVALRIGVLGSLLNKRSALSIRNRVLLYKQLIQLMMEGWRLTHIRKLQMLQSVFALLIMHLGELVTSTRIWKFHFSATRTDL